MYPTAGFGPPFFLPTEKSYPATMTMPPSSLKQDWQRYWQEARATGALFRQAGTQDHPALNAFWKNALLEEHGPQLDIACGAETVLQHKGLPGPLFAVDVSSAALLKLRKRYAAAVGVQADACGLPFASNAIPQVVSQFGVEYGGVEAFREAGRVLAPGGHLLLLCHLEGSAIERTSAAELRVLETLLDLKFLPAAKAVLNAAYEGNETALDHAVHQFIAAERPLAAALETGASSLAQHIYDGFRALFENHGRYAREDALAWLEGAAAQVEEACYRLKAILGAALNAERREAALTALTQQGVQALRTEPLLLPGQRYPVGLVLEGRCA
jgi:SAM-dependent methyltransferase